MNTTQPVYDFDEYFDDYNLDIGEMEYCNDCGDWSVPIAQVVYDEISHTKKRILLRMWGIFEEEN